MAVKIRSVSFISSLTKITRSFLLFPLLMVASMIWVLAVFWVLLTSLLTLLLTSLLTQGHYLTRLVASLVGVLSFVLVIIVLNLSSGNELIQPEMTFVKAYSLSQ